MRFHYHTMTEEEFQALTGQPSSVLVVPWRPKPAPSPSDSKRRGPDEPQPKPEAPARSRGSRRVRRAPAETN
jgi:hypothetical protein